MIIGTGNNSVRNYNTRLQHRQWNAAPECTEYCIW